MRCIGSSIYESAECRALETTATERRARLLGHSRCPSRAVLKPLNRSIHGRILRILFDREAEIATELHHGLVLAQDGAMEPADATCARVADEMLHQHPAQAAAF